MLYVFLLIGLVVAIFFLIGLAKTLVGKIIFGIIILILVVKLLKFIKKDHKYWFRITKKSAILSIFVVISTLFINDVMLTSASTLTRTIIYIIDFAIIIYLQVNKNYSYNKTSDIYKKSKADFEKTIEEKKADGTYDKWLLEQNKRRNKYDELTEAIKEFKNSNSRDFKLEWLNKYSNIIKIKENRNDKIYSINDITDINLRLDIVEYAKEYLCIEGISPLYEQYMAGDIDDARIGLPIKIVRSYNSVFIKKFIYKGFKNYKYLVIDIDYHIVTSNIVNIICNVEDYENKKVVIINSKQILNNIERSKESFGSYDGNHGTIECYDKSILKIDYRH